MQEPTPATPVSEAAPAGADRAAARFDPQVPDIGTSRYIARILDMSLKVPGTGFHVGADSIVGLVPVVGDVVTGAAGCVILAEAARHKVPPETMGKMVMNLGIDVAGGAIMPGVGDVFDVFWKANKKNLTLLEDHLGLERTFPRGGEERKDTEAVKFARKPAPGAATAAGLAAGAGGATGAGNEASHGGTHIEFIRSTANPKLEFVKYTFVVENMGRRSETNVHGGGGGGMVYGSGGYVYGATAPVTIRSSTTHKSELWFTNENGREDWVWINLDTLMVRDGHTVSLIFARRNGKRGAFLAARNESTGMQKDMESKGYQQAAWKGFPVLTVLAVALCVLLALTVGEVGVLLAFAAVLPLLVTTALRGRAVRKEVHRLLDG